MKDKIEKVYWTITEVTEIINVKASTIRFWEKHFEWIKPKKSRKGKRAYRKNQVDAVCIINLLVNDLGMTLEGVLNAHLRGYKKDLEQIILTWIQENRYDCAI